MSSETAIVEASARQIVPSELMGSGQAAVKTFKAIIDKSTVEIQGKGGQVSKHLRVEGWTSIAQGMGAEIRVPTIEMQPDGSVEAIAIVTINGRDFEGRGWVGVDEARWAKASMSHRRAMAQTRAIGRACRHALSWVRVLLGDDYSATPAEEMEGLDGFGPPQPSKATKEQWSRISQLIEQTGTDTKTLETKYGPGSTITQAKADQIIRDLEAQARGGQA